MHFERVLGFASFLLTDSCQRDEVNINMHVSNPQVELQYGWVAVTSSHEGGVSFMCTEQEWTPFRSHY